MLHPMRLASSFATLLVLGLGGFIACDSDGTALVLPSSQPEVPHVFVGHLDGSSALRNKEWARIGREVYGSRIHVGECTRESNRHRVEVVPAKAGLPKPELPFFIERAPVFELTPYGEQGVCVLRRGPRTWKDWGRCTRDTC